MINELVGRCLELWDAPSNVFKLLLDGPLRFLAVLGVFYTFDLAVKLDIEPRLETLAEALLGVNTAFDNFPSASMETPSSMLLKLNF